MIRQICLAAVLILCLGGTCLGAEEAAEAFDPGGLTQAAGEYAPEWGIGLDGGLSSLLERGANEVGTVLRKSLRSGIMLLTIVLLFGLVGGMDGSAAPTAMPIAAALSIAAVAVTDAQSLIGLGRQTIATMEAFSKVLLPTITAAAAAGGAPAASAARQLATMLFSDVLITVISQVLIPLTYAYIAACTAYAAVGNEGLRRVAGTLKWMAGGILTLILIAFVGYLSVSGAIAGTVDAATIRAAKFTMSSLVPVVGGILSDAAETVMAGAGILRNTVGIFGMVVVLAMCVVPFLQLGMHYLTYKIAAALSATVADGRSAGLVDNIGGAFGLMLGMTGSCALLLLVSLVSAISVTVP